MLNELFKKLPWNKKIQVLRIVKEWTQQEAAERCNTNQKNFWNWESGKSYPNKNSRLIISKVFEVDESEIFGGEERG